MLDHTMTTTTTRRGSRSNKNNNIIIENNNNDCNDNNCRDEEIREFIEVMERLYCPMPIRSRLENYFLQEKEYHHDPNFELVADTLDWMMHRYDLKKNPSSSPDDHKNYTATSGTENKQEMMVKRRIPIDSESDRIQFVKEAVLFFHEKEHIQLGSKAIYAADDTSLKELAKIAEILMDAVNVETEYRTSKMKKSQGKEGEEELQILLQEQHQQDEEEAKDTLIMASSLPSGSLLVDDLNSLTSLGKTLTESAARLHELLQKHSEHQKEISNISTVYNNVGSNHDGTHASQQEQDGVGEKGQPQLLLDTMTTIESFIKEKIESIQQEVFSLEEELAHLKADENDLLFDLNNKNEELERNTIRLRNLQDTRPSFMDEQETLQKELQKHYELYMERFRNIHYLHHELKLVEKEEQTLQDKFQKRTMERQARLREEEQQISAQMMLPNSHDRQPFKKHSKKDDLASSQQPAKTKQNLDFDAIGHHPPKETNHHKDNTHDSSSSASGSSALIISQCSNEEQLGNHSDKSMESSFSRTTSISVDSSTYFMNGPDFKSFVSPTSKSSLSGDESDDNF